MKRKYLLKKNLFRVLALAAMISVATPSMPVTVKAQEAVVSEVFEGIDLAAVEVPKITAQDCEELGLTEEYVDYYAISTSEQLYWFAGLVNGTLEGVEADVRACAVLTDDIVVNTGVVDANGELVTGVAFTEWTPIGTALSPFMGTFDGCGYTISGLYNVGTSTGINYVGLFGNVEKDGFSTSEIKNVTVADSYFAAQVYNESYVDNYGYTQNVTTNGYCGGICGYNNGGIIENCYNEASFCSESTGLGGICGTNRGQIISCENNAYIVGEAGRVGGICGNNYGQIVNCGNNADIYGKSDNVGGICGNNEGEISGCYNAGTIMTLASDNGGIAGLTYGEITNCYNTGVIASNSYMNGGIAGFAYGAEITGCYNTGNVTAADCKPGQSNDSTGGIVGYSDKVTITRCYNTGEITGTNDVAGISGWNSGVTISECYNIGTITGNGTVGQIGGIVGECCGSINTITNVYNAGDVIGTTYVGGIAGINVVHDKLANCYNTGEICATVEPEYRSSTCIWPVGAISGWTSSQMSITNCYYLEDDSIITGSGQELTHKRDAEGVMEAVSLDQLAIGEVAYKLAQGNPVWGQLIGTSDAPVLSGDNCQKVYRTEAEYCDGTEGGYFYSNEENASGVAHDYEDGVCTKCGESRVSLDAKLMGHSLVLGEKIAVKFYVSLDESVLNDENAYMQFSLSDGTTTKVMVSDVKNKPDTAENGDVRYVFTCEVAAKDMETEISAQIIASDDINSDVWTYTVKEYADAILSDSEQDEATKELVQSMIDYGTLTQNYFSGESDSAEEVEVAPVEVSDLANYAPSLKPANIDNGVTYYGSSLILESSVIVRHYFTASEDAPEAALEGLTKSGNYYYADSEGVSVKDFATMKEYNVAGHTITYSPLSYVRSVLGNSDFDGDTALKNVLKSMYHYYMASVDYKGAE